MALFSFMLLSRWNLTGCRKMCAWAAGFALFQTSKSDDSSLNMTNNMSCYSHLDTQTQTQTFTTRTECRFVASINGGITTSEFLIVSIFIDISICRQIFDALSWNVEFLFIGGDLLYAEVHPIRIYRCLPERCFLDSGGMLHHFRLIFSSIHSFHCIKRLCCCCCSFLCIFFGWTGNWTDESVRALLSFIVSFLFHIAP